MKLSFRSFASLLLIGTSLFLLSCTPPRAAETSSPSQEYSWRLTPDVTTLKFDVTNVVGEAGTYLAMFQWKSGDNALKISSVALYQGDQQISQDAHIGEAGTVNLKNVYVLELPKATTSTGPYTLRARVKGIGGTSSLGIMTIRKAQPGETPQKYSWRLKSDTTTLQFDIADAVREAGTYTATFQWRRGDHALRVKSVAVYQGDQKISEDAHVGETGVANLKNVYVLELPGAATNDSPYTLRAQVESVGGGNSFGIVTVRKTDPKDPKVYAWELAPDITTLKFDVADVVVEAGTYSATIQWKRGINALKVKSIALYEGDKKVAEDVHEGWTGFENRDNAYTLELPTYRTGQEAYTLRAQVEGAAGTDCSGILTLGKIK